MNYLKRITKKAAFLFAHNPSLFFKLLLKNLRYNILIRQGMPKTPVRKKVNGIFFDFDFDLDPTVKEMYAGYYEPETVNVMERVLKPGDIFIDVGAHIGYLSAVGAGLVGKTGEVHSFEPVPRCFQKLKEMAKINPGHKIIINQYALGEEEGAANIDIANIRYISWNTMVANLIEKEDRKETLKIPVRRLDTYIKDKALNKISLIKIDVEGFEYPVLKSLKNYFENTDNRPVIICEIFPNTAYSLLGFTISQLTEYMRKYGYNAYSPFDIKTRVDIAKLREDVKEAFIAVFISN